MTLSKKQSSDSEDSEYANEPEVTRPNTPEEIRSPLREFSPQPQKPKGKKDVKWDQRADKDMDMKDLQMKYIELKCQNHQLQNMKLRKDLGLPEPLQPQIFFSFLEAAFLKIL